MKIFQGSDLSVGMEDAMEDLLSALLGVYKNVLMREHFFTCVSSTYEIAVFRPVSCFPLIPQPLEINFRARSSTGKRTKTRHIKEPVSGSPETRGKSEISPHPKPLGIIINEEFLTQTKSTEIDFKHIVSDFTSKIESAHAEESQEKHRFLSSLNSRFPRRRRDLLWDREVGKSLACYLFLTQMLELLSSPEFMKAVLTAVLADDQSYYTIGEVLETQKAVQFLLWIEQEVPIVKKQTQIDESSILIEGVKAVFNSIGTIPMPSFDGFKGENRLLTRVKTCQNDEQIKILISEFERFCLWHVQAETVKFVKQRLTSGESLKVLRMLQSLLKKDGKMLCTVQSEDR